MTKTINLAGKRFGKLVVVERVSNSNAGKARWSCQCDCGNTRVEVGSDLRNGKVMSCGCINRKHGLSKTRLYNTFTAMKERCYNEQSVSYPWYGAEGIRIYRPWLNDFSKFYEWAYANGYEDDLEIDRIDSSKDYSPDNCRWANRTVQNRNQRTRIDNKSGVRGVKWNKQRNKWQATIDADKKRHYLGFFTNISDAAEARKTAELKYWNN